MNFTIDDAIEICKDRAGIAALHHMMNDSQKWEQVGEWLERLRDASEHIEAAIMNFKIDYAPPQAEDTIYDMRERQRDRTIKQVCEILDSLSATKGDSDV